jgi:hypothetical protein
LDYFQRPPTGTVRTPSIITHEGHVVGDERVLVRKARLVDAVEDTVGDGLTAAVNVEEVIDVLTIVIVDGSLLARDDEQGSIGASGEPLRQKAGRPIALLAH